MNWILLIIAGLFEIGFTTCLGKAKATQGTEATLWLFGFVACPAISMGLVYKVTQTLPIGTTYAVWTGIGAAGTVLVGLFVFDEPATFWRIIFLLMLIISIIGLKAVAD